MLQGRSAASAPAPFARTGTDAARPLPARLARSALAAYAVASLLGVAAVAWTFPVRAILGTDAYTDPASGDAAQHVIGQRAFLADAWRWPPLTTQLLMPPGGVNIGLTDSIPLAALPAKLLRAWLPRDFEAVFPWLALCWLVQPLAAVFALRGTGERRLLPAVAAAAVSLSMPTLIWRFGHAALCSHFLLLAALGLYFRAVAGRRWAPWAGAGLVVLSLLVHPYLMAMCAALLGAAPLTLLLRRELAWTRCALAFAVGAALAFGLARLLGYAGVAAPGGFGLFSMNLLSPVYPGRSWLIPWWPDTPDATGGQAEGYQYLGAGLLVLLAALLLFRGTAARQALQRHGGLLAACVGLTLFAASNRMYLGHSPVLLTRAPPFLAQFRATGRFFWPVAYALAIGGIALAARTLSRRAAAGLLTAVALLQGADVYAQRLGLRWIMHERRAWAIDAAALRPLLASHERLSIWPGAACWMRPEAPALLHLLLLATETQTPADTMYVARTASEAGCPPPALLRTPPAPGELRVFLPGSPAGAVLEQPDAAATCRQVGALVACARDMVGQPGLPPFRAEPLPFGQALATVAGGPGVPALGGGWWAPDAAGVRAVADEAQLALPCGTTAADRAAVLVVTATTPPGHAPLGVAVELSGAPAAAWVLPAAASVNTLPLPAASCRNGAIRVALRSDGLRDAGLRLRSIQVRAQAE